MCSVSETQPVSQPTMVPVHKINAYALHVKKCSLEYKDHLATLSFGDKSKFVSQKYKDMTIEQMSALKAEVAQINHSKNG